MSRIRSNNTKPDLQMKEILSDLKCKYEMYPKMYGKPDFVLSNKRIVIFCDGDFWHGYNYYKKKKPLKKYWRNKIEGNMKRDRLVSQRLRKDGWAVLRFWEHTIRKKPHLCKNKIIRKIVERKNSTYL